MFLRIAGPVTSGKESSTANLWGKYQGLRYLYLAEFQFYIKRIKQATFSKVKQVCKHSEKRQYEYTYQLFSMLITTKTQCQESLNRNSETKYSTWDCAEDL